MSHSSAHLMALAFGMAALYDQDDDVVHFGPIISMDYLHLSVEPLVVEHPPTYVFETMTVAHAQAFDAGRHVVFYALEPMRLAEGVGDDLIRSAIPLRGDWESERERHGPPPRVLGRQAAYPRTVHRHRSGKRGK